MHGAAEPDLVLPHQGLGLDQRDVVAAVAMQHDGGLARPAAVRIGLGLGGGRIEQRPDDDQQHDADPDPAHVRRSVTGMGAAVTALRFGTTTAST